MTLKELYENIGADYDQALRVLRIDRLLNKHIQRFPKNDAVSRLVACKETMDAVELFESAHAIKGLCANLGLTEMSEKAAVIADEFRVGNARSKSDAEVKAILDEIDALYQKTCQGIAEYVNS